MSRLSLVGVLAALSLVALTDVPAEAAVNEYALPGGASAPVGIVAGPGGNLWFTEQDGSCAPQNQPATCGAIGEMTTSGTLVAEYPLPSPNSTPSGIAVGPDDAIWFTETGAGAIGRLDPSAAQPGTSNGITEYSTPTADSQPAGITVGPDGALWFTERAYSDGNRIGRIDPGTHAMTEYCIRVCGAPPNGVRYSFPPTGLEPTGIVAGPDGHLWFTETNPYCSGSETDAQGNPAPTMCDPYDNGSGNDDGVGAIGELDPSSAQPDSVSTKAQATEYHLPTPSGQEPNSQPLDLAVGPDGALWFTEYNSSTVGRISTGGQITEYPVPGTDTQPTGIAAGPDGKLWFALAGSPSGGANRIAEIDPASASPGTDSGIGRFPQLTPVRSCPNCPAASSQPMSLAEGADGNMWFTEQAADRIGQLSPNTGTTAPAPPPPTETVIQPPPEIVTIPGPPAFPVLGRLRLSANPFAVTSSPTSRPTMLRRRRCHRSAVGCQAVKRLRPPRGTVFEFTLNAPATIRVTIYSPSSAATYGRLTAQAVPGSNRLPFTGWIGRHPLAPGAYAAELVATNVIESSPPTKQVSRPVTVRFRILARAGPSTGH